MAEKKQKNWMSQKELLLPIACKMCGRVIKHPVRGQKVCVFVYVKKQTKCQIKLNRIRSAARTKRNQERRENGKVLPTLVICDQCGYEIEHPEFATSSPTKLQMRCTINNGRPWQRIVGSYSGCQVKYNNDRQKEKREKQKETILGLVQGKYEKPDGEPRQINPPEKRIMPTKHDKAILIGRPKGVRGKYSEKYSENNNGERKLRTCLGVLCTEE